jgi:hypothetical protein
MSGKTVQRSWAALEANGFTVPHYRKRQTAERVFPMPEIAVVALEIEKKLRRTPSVRKTNQGRTNLSDQDVVCGNSATQTLERTNLALRTDRSVRQPQSFLPQSRSEDQERIVSNYGSYNRGEKTELETQIDAVARSLDDLRKIARSARKGGRS